MLQERTRDSDAHAEGRRPGRAREPVRGRGGAAEERSRREGGPTLTEFGSGFLDRRERAGIRGIRQDRARWSLFVDRPDRQLVLTEIEKTDVLDWLDRFSGRAYQTRVNALNLLRTAGDDAARRDLWKENVFRLVSVHRAGRAKETDDLEGILQPDEQRALVDAIPAGIDKHTVAFALLTGLRQGSQ